MNKIFASHLTHAQLIKTPSFYARPEFFQIRAVRRLFFKLTFKPFKNIFVDCPRVIGLCTDGTIVIIIKLIVIFCINIWIFPAFLIFFNFDFSKNLGEGDGWLVSPPDCHVLISVAVYIHFD